MNAKRYKIIVVDDIMANLTMCMNVLKTFYDVSPVQSGTKFFEILEKVNPDLVLLDIEMPEMNGYEVLKKMKKDPRFTDTPVIFLTAKDDENSELEGFDLGAMDYVSKPFSVPLLLKRIENQLLIKQQKKDLLESREQLEGYADNLMEKVREKTKEVNNLQNAVLTTLADLVEFRDKLTGAHITRTQLYLKSLVEELLRENLYSNIINKWDIDFFLMSAPLHDVGKIAISDLILNKPDKLTSDEYEIMKTHVISGVNTIEKIMKKTDKLSFLHHALPITGTHHEKWDGTGYPLGLKGKNIPLEGRLMAIADVYDALVSVRPYKKAYTHEEACKKIEEGEGTHFDPVLIRVFKIVKGEFDTTVQEIGFQHGNL